MGNAGTALRADDGASWNAADPGTSNDLHDVFFVSASTGWIAGESGVVSKSTGSGSSYQSLYSTSTTFNAVHFVSTAVGYFAGNSGAILKSTDSGTSFTVERSLTSNHLNGIFFPSAALGIAVGDSGTIVREGTASSSPEAEVPPQGSLKAVNNLFNPAKGESVQIRYAIVNSGKVTVRVYTPQGRLVKTLIDEQRTAGSYSDLSWNGSNGIGETVASGIYLVHIEGPRFSQTRKIAVVR